MRVVALEEHFTVPAVVAESIKRTRSAAAAYKGRKVAPGKAEPDGAPARDRREALEVDGRRRHHRAGAVEQRPRPRPGARRRTASRWRARCNDYLAGVVAKHPKRFAGFAALPMASPDACAAELRRAVKDLKFVGAMIHGTTDGRFLDHPSYDGLLAAAVELDVPIYIHPHRADAGVQKAYYSGLPEGADRVRRTAGWGWHSEVAIHILRMVFAGTFDKHPKLKMIIGHMGEMLPVMLARLDEVVCGRRRAPQAAAEPDHHRSGLDHHQRHLQPAAVHRRAADVRHRPHHVLGRLSVRARRTEAANSSTRSRWRRCRHGEALPWQRRCVAEAEGLNGATATSSRRVNG